MTNTDRLTVVHKTKHFVLYRHDYNDGSYGYDLKDKRTGVIEQQWAECPFEGYVAMMNAERNVKTH